MGAQSQMPRYSFQIQDAETISGVDLADRDAAHTYAIDLASDRLAAQTGTSGTRELRITIQDETGEVLDTLYSVAE